jgi:hypothetical protein
MSVGLGMPVCATFSGTRHRRGASRIAAVSAEQVALIPPVRGVRRNLVAQ